MVEPDTTSVLTRPLAFGFQSGSTVPLLRMWASRLRACPPTEVNVPLMYQPPDPSRADAATAPPVTCGQFARGCAVVASSAAEAPVFGPTFANVPRMYSVAPESTAALTAPSVTASEAFEVVLG